MVSGYGSTVSVWLSSTIVLIFCPLSTLVDPLFEYLARISSADTVSIEFCCSICEWSSSGILRSRRCELLPTSRRRRAEIALDERFSLDLLLTGFIIDTVFPALDEVSLDILLVVEVFDKSINGKWTDRESVGDFNGVIVCWENFPLSSKIPLSDI